MAGTKGPSNLYGNKNQVPTDHINYPYAKEFKQNTLEKHFRDHGKEIGANSMNDYENKAIYFANHISTIADSFIDDSGTTFKYNYATNKLVIVDKNVIIISFFKPSRKEEYNYRIKEKQLKKK